MRGKSIKSVVVVLAFAVLLILSTLGLSGRKAVTYAAAETPLLDKTSSFTVTQVLNDKNVDILQNPETKVYYGDDFVVTMEWTIDTEITSDDILTYQLPEEIEFEDVTDGEIKNGAKTIGSYSIIGNKISLNYTDAEFLAGNPKVGELSLAGKIESKLDGQKPAEIIEVYFTADVSVKFNMTPPTQVPDMEIHNRIKDTDTSITDHIYVNVVQFTSHGNNTNIKFNDGMYPGMMLYSEPKFFTDKKCTIALDSSRYTIDSAEINSREVNATIPYMEDGETFYVKYNIYVIPEMYEWETADKYINDNDLVTDFYPNQFEGRVPNRAYVKSTETLESDTNGTSNSNRTDGLRTSWADVITMRGSFNKWADPDENKDGYLHWEIIIYSIKGKKFNSGCVVDILPMNTSYVDSLEVIDSVTGDPVQGYVNVETKDLGNGNTEVVFNFTNDMMVYLASSGEAQVLLRYYTKIDRQSEKGTNYKNNAEIRYDNERGRSTIADMYYTKPDELTKTSKYTAATAPYVEYTIKVNPAALDLDPGSTVLTLEDEMSSSYDLVPGTVKINDKAATEDDYVYVAPSRKMTFNLSDSTAYTITYKAAVNLVPGSTLDESNGGNSVKLYSKSMSPIEKENIIKCQVYKSAASSSSLQNIYTLNVIKYDGASSGNLLSDARFTLVPAELKNGVLTIDKGAVKQEKKTDENGLASFGGLYKGIIYMLVENEAPQGYDKIEEPLFYAFSSDEIKNVTNITYEGKTYSVNLIDSSKVSYDLYLANSKTQTNQGETNNNNNSQNNSGSTDKNDSGSTDKNDSGSTDKIENSTKDDKQESSDSKDIDPSKMEENSAATPSNNSTPDSGASTKTDNTPNTPASGTGNGTGNPSASSSDKQKTEVSVPAPAPAAGQKGSTAVKTGDEAKQLLLAEIVLFVSLFAIIAIIIKKIIK